MKRALAVLFCLALASPGGLAVVGTPDNVPAATLLLPYFEVDLDDALNGTNTTFRIGNSRSAPTLAHVTLWTDRGVPTWSFDLYLGGWDVEKVDLRLLFNGIVPQGSPATNPDPGSLSGPHTNFPFCDLPIGKLPSATVTALRDAHSGVASSLLGGNCGGSPRNDGHARGYVTIDVTNQCTDLFPGAPNYFVAGGNGIASNDNVLWGSWRMYDRATSLSWGGNLVSIEAGATDDSTFYGRLIGSSGADNRETLPPRWMGRTVNEDELQTWSMVWRDPGSVEPFPCDSPSAGLTTGPILAFDDQEHPSTAGPLAESGFPLAAQRVNLSDPSTAFVPSGAGMVTYDLDLSGGSVRFGRGSQSWVTHVLASPALMATGLAVWTPPPHEWPDLGGGGGPQPECLDGIDNDGDGEIDAADSNCVKTPWGGWWFGEAPQCSDGIENDSWEPDGTDYPNDPDCSGPGEQYEAAWYNYTCGDGIDNDGDGLIDIQEDPSCANPYQYEESRGPCDDGVDNDSDGNIDYPADPGCGSISSPKEDPQCQDGIDNDGDGEIDTADAACTSVSVDLEGPECDDGVDNDGDGTTDYPADPSCTSSTGGSEATPCSNNIDDDADGLIDSADPGCADPRTGVENPQCNNGIDDDSDGQIDWSNDPGCELASSVTESPACNDGVDNDDDELVDYPADPGCAHPWTDLGSIAGGEGYTCADGVDNDGDGLVDYPNETGCFNAWDRNEGPDCSDGEDNDGDGLADSADPGCASPGDLNEQWGTTTRECSDGLDNDGDGMTDMADAGCGSAWDNNEY